MYILTNIYIQGARSLGMSFSADADDALWQQIHNDTRPWRCIVTTHCLTHCPCTDDTLPPEDALWRHIAWRRIVHWRHINPWRRIVTTHCLTMQCQLTTLLLTTHCDDALPPDDIWGMPIWDVLWRGGTPLHSSQAATCSHSLGIFSGGHLQPLASNFLRRLRVAARCQKWYVTHCKASLCFQMTGVH